MSNDLLYVDVPMNHSIDNPHPIKEDDNDDEDDEVYFQFEGDKNNNGLSKTTIKKP